MDQIIAGKYKVLSQIGRGGMGTVYQVRHLTLDTTCALKVLPTELATDTDLVSRFHQEARVMAQLSHPHIVRVSDVDRDGDTHFLVMDYIAGESLSQYLRKHGALPLPEVVAIARQVAQALEYAHSHQPPVIHRDIKPSNILLEEGSGRAMVTDFGIAKVLGTMERTHTGLMLGTLRYCAPEQILQDKDLDGRVDLYALGLVIYEMAAGHPFFTETDEPALLGRVLYGPEENVPIFTNPVPPEFSALVTRAIARGREHRYPRVAELLRDIEACKILPSATSPTERRGAPLPPRREEDRGAEKEQEPAFPGQAQGRQEKAQQVEQGKIPEQRSRPQERQREEAADRQAKARIGRSPSFFSIRWRLLIGGVIGVGLVLALWFPWEAQPPRLPQDTQAKAIGVMYFKALSVDPQLEWMRDAIRDNLNSQLSSVADLKVYSKEYIDFLVQKRLSTDIEVANELGIAKMISGSFMAIANRLHIEAHVVDVQSGLLQVSDHVEGEQSDFFNLQRQLAGKIMARLNLAMSSGEKAIVSSTPETPSLDRYKLLLEADGETAARPVEGDGPRSQGAPRRGEDKHSRFPLWQGWPKASTAWADEVAQQRLAPEEEIREVLEIYRQAYEKKDLALLNNVFAVVTPSQREALVQYFQYARELRVTLSDIDIAVWGDEAAVSCTREDQFVDTQTGRPVKLHTRFTKIFVRTDGAWRIAGKKEQCAVRLEKGVTDERGGDKIKSVDGTVPAGFCPARGGADFVPLMCFATKQSQGPDRCAYRRVLVSTLRRRQYLWGEGGWASLCRRSVCRYCAGSNAGVSSGFGRPRIYIPLQSSC
jgi:serine/threonine protein kinase/TolB-like protein